MSVDSLNNDLARLTVEDTRPSVRSRSQNNNLPRKARRVSSNDESLLRYPQPSSLVINTKVKTPICIEVAESKALNELVSSTKDNTKPIYAHLLENKTHFWSQSDCAVGRIFRKFKKTRANQDATHNDEEAAKAQQQGSEEGEERELVTGQNKPEKDGESLDDFEDGEQYEFTEEVEDSSSLEEEDGESLEYAECVEEYEFTEEFEDAGTVTEVFEERDEHESRARSSGPLKMGTTGQRWTEDEDRLLNDAVNTHGARNWRKVAEQLPGRNPVQCNQRWKRLQPDRIRGNWTKEEDRMLLDLARQYKTNWAVIAKHIRGRTGKQVRERYLNTLDPSIKRTKWTPEEDYKLMTLFKELGSVWSEIAKYLDGRSENMVKNRYYSCLKKKFGDMSKEQIAQATRLEKAEMYGKMEKSSNCADLGSTDSGSLYSADVLNDLSSASGLSPRQDEMETFKNVDGFFMNSTDEEEYRGQREFSSGAAFDEFAPGMTSAELVNLESADTNPTGMHFGAQATMGLPSNDFTGIGQGTNSMFMSAASYPVGMSATMVAAHDCSCPVDTARVDFDTLNLEDPERIDSGFFKEREFVYDFDNRSRGNSLRNNSAIAMSASYRSDSNVSAMTELSRISQFITDDQSDRSSRIEQLSSLREKLANLTDMVSQELGELQNP